MKENIEAKKALKEDIREIEFSKSPNVFINAGIIALEHYLEKFKDEKKIEYEFELTEQKLVLKSDRLLTLLEDVYYFMGKEIYDTSGANARKKQDKFYFIKEPFEGIPFYKMKTYGLAELITNDAQATKSKNGDKIKFGKLYEQDREFAEKIASFLHNKDKKLKYFSFEDGVLKPNKIIDDSSGKREENTGGDSEIFIDDSYKKITDLNISSEYLERGEQVCYLTGESYKKLVDTTCTSPFISGILNFNSNFSAKGQKVSWKVMYLSRFSPKLCFYSYTGDLDTLMTYFFVTDNLINLKQLYRQNSSIYKNSIDLVNENYKSNFNLYNWGSDKQVDFYTEQYEYLFMLIYTFYKNFLYTSMIDVSGKSGGCDPFAGTEYAKIPISLVFFKSEKLSTLQPNHFEEIDNLKVIVRMIYEFEYNGLNVKDLLSSLKFLKPAVEKSKKSNRLERQLRNKVLEKVIKTKSILTEIENLFFNCYKLLVGKDEHKKFGRYKNFGQLTEFVTIYEKIINYGGDLNMNPELQEKAINLGKSIGQGILNFESSPNDEIRKKANARNGRGYIISLKKARNLQQFLDEIIRLQTKYCISISNEIIKQVNPQNFNAIKQFAIIGALNQLNIVLSSQNKENKNDSK